MDRKLTREKIHKLTFFKQFEYLDIIPYSIAVLMVTGGIYIFNGFLEISKHLVLFAK